jgi:hypothetical protein
VKALTNHGDTEQIEMSRRFAALEEISGLAGFLAGLLLVWLGFEMFADVRSAFTKGTVLASIVIAWGAALAATSSRGGKWRIYFRLAANLHG